MKTILFIQLNNILKWKKKSQANFAVTLLSQLNSSVVSFLFFFFFLCVFLIPAVQHTSNQSVVILLGKLHYLTFHLKNN